MPHKGSAYSGNDRADGKGDNLVPEKADPHRFRGDLIFPDCLEGFPVAAVYQIDHKENSESGKTPAPPDGSETGKPLEPQSTVCQGLGVCKDYPDYFSKPEGG
jgi:hypothetical protein